MDLYIEKEKVLNIYGEYDVIIAGGGTAGSVAAVAAARSGARVLVVEQFGALGGAATEGLVTPLMHIAIEGNPMCSSISDEINDRMVEYGFCDKNKRHFDPLMLKFVLEELVLEAGAEILYYTYICDVIKEDDRIKGLIIENKAGRSAVYAKCVVDSTGDGDVAFRAGVPFESGNPATGKNQPMSVRYIMSGIDMTSFLEFINKICEGKNIFHYGIKLPILHGAVVWDRNWPLEQLFRQAYEAGDITYEDGAYWQYFSIPNRPDSLAFNCPEIFEGIDGTNPVDLTNAQLYAKKTIMRHIKFYKKYFPGFENSYVSELASQVGIRESRRIKGTYELTDEDMLLYRKFDDSIARSNYPVDIHGIKLENRHIYMEGRDSVPYYDIPYRSLVPIQIKGLIIAGRCISATFTAQSSLRIQPTVRAIGEAAGIAAAISAKSAIELCDINGRDIRQEMILRGARFE